MSAAHLRAAAPCCWSAPAQGGKAGQQAGSRWSAARVQETRGSGFGLLLAARCRAAPGAATLPPEHYPTQQHTQSPTAGKQAPTPRVVAFSFLCGRTFSGGICIEAGRDAWDVMLHGESMRGQREWQRRAASHGSLRWPAVDLLRGRRSPITCVPATGRTAAS